MAFLDSDYGVNYEEIEDWVKKAYEILEAKNTEEYTSDRILISNSRGCLVIRFDARENTGSEYWSTVLNLSSKGNIQNIGRAHLSEVEAGEGDDEYSYMPWTTWLNRVHTRVMKDT
jgi:hypothetical protein